MVDICVNTSFPSYQATGRSEQPIKHSGRRKYRLKLRDPLKKLFFLDKMLWMKTEGFALYLYNFPKHDKGICDCVQMLLQQEVTFFNVTKDNPYVFNRNKEVGFLSYVIDCEQSKLTLESGRYSVLKKYVQSVDDYGRRIEKIKKSNESLRGYRFQIENLVNACSKAMTTQA